MIRVESWGIAASVVGPGVVGRAWLGAPRGGAVDLPAFELANRLLGNPVGALAFETSGNTTLRVEQAAMVVIAGAVAEVTVRDGPPVGWGAPVVLPAGAMLRVGRLLDGARAYVGVRGGVEVVDGDVLRLGADPASPATIEAAPRAATCHVLRVFPGPRIDWFVDDAWQQLVGAPFTVTTTSRVGTRLRGPHVGRHRRGELPSEGLVEGAVQVPPDGQPIVMLADHPTTGGYPVIAVVHPDDLTHAAQAAPGAAVRFVPARQQ